MDHDFLTSLFREGRAVVALGREGMPPLPREESLTILAAAYESHRLEVAGPLLPFRPDPALDAAGLLRSACRALVSRIDRVDDLASRLTMPHPPAEPADHLSADLTLRYLPQVHHRARAIDPADPLVEMLARVLRQWPLSGVLADLDEGPAAPPNFGGHPGLCLLYAERLARRGDRPAWQPAAGLASEFLELVRDGSESMQEMTRR